MPLRARSYIGLAVRSTSLSPSDKTTAPPSGFTKPTTM